MTEQHRGSYGFRLVGSGLRGLQRGFLNPVDPAAPQLSLFMERGGPFEDIDEVDAGDQRTLQLIDGAMCSANRETSSAIFRFPTPPSPDELLHPWLAAVAPSFAEWQGWNVLHASVVAGAEGAVALVADREGGKSTTTAALAGAGFPVLADDLCVVADGQVFAGPRLIDLRASSAERLRHLPLQRARNGERQRLILPACAPRLPLRAIVLLTWGETIDLRPVAVSQRIPLLLRHAHVPAGLEARSRVLDLASVPVHVLTRPRDWASLEGACRQVETLLDTKVGAGRRG